MKLSYSRGEKDLAPSSSKTMSNQPGRLMIFLMFKLFLNLVVW